LKSAINGFISRTYDESTQPTDKESEMFTSKRTKTPKTEHTYEVVSARLFRKFQSETDRPFRNNHYEFLTWLLAKRETWADPSWVYNKSALIHTTSKIGLRTLHARLLETDNKGGTGKTKRLPPNRRKTSAKKAKHVSEKALIAIINAYPTLANNYWAKCGLYFFVSSYYVGLRPCEYEKSTLEYHRNASGSLTLFLRVKNAKHTNGRAHGEYRHIPLDNCNKDIIDVIAETIAISQSPKSAKNKPIEFMKFKNYASAAFSDYTKKLFPNRKTTITLYTARHQFCANLKRAGLSQAEIAALMGHRNDATNGASYGKKRYGTKSRFIPRPLQQEVAKVIRTGRTTNFFKKKSAEKRTPAQKPNSLNKK
jgi:hypothetical protein